MTASAAGSRPATGAVAADAAVGASRTRPSRTAVAIRRGVLTSAILTRSHALLAGFLQLPARCDRVRHMLRLFRRSSLAALAVMLIAPAAGQAAGTAVDVQRGLQQLVAAPG